MDSVRDHHVWDHPFFHLRPTRAQLLVGQTGWWDNRWYPSSSTRLVHQLNYRATECLTDRILILCLNRAHRAPNWSLTALPSAKRHRRSSFSRLELELPSSVLVPSAYYYHFTVKQVFEWMSGVSPKRTQPTSFVPEETCPTSHMFEYVFIMGRWDVLD